MTRRTRFLTILGLTAVVAFASVGVASVAPKTKLRHFGHTAKLIVRSDDQHGRKGPDGKWHDAFLPADFSVARGARVKVTILNYDDSPHSFTSPGLHLNELVPGAKGKTPGRITFTLTAKKAGKYAWWCNQPCDPWAMAHDGYMRGFVTVA